MKQVWLFFLSAFFTFPFQSRAQDASFREELRFSRYLLDKELFREAFKVLSEMDTTGAGAAELDDYFYTYGWAAYQTKKLDTSIGMLLKVSGQSERFAKSRAFAAYNFAYLGNTVASDSIFVTMEPGDPVEKELLAFERAGIALLRRDFSLYDTIRQRFTYSSYILQEEEKRMEIYREKIAGFRSKSPLLAGLYSAVLPGSGKWYAGKKKQAIAAFLPVVSLGAIAYEAYRKGGVKDARLIGFGSLFSLFYVGNIWGSVLSVRVREKEFKREYENKILFDMHIPLRNFYN